MASKFTRVNGRLVATQTQIGQQTQAKLLKKTQAQNIQRQKISQAIKDKINFYINKINTIQKELEASNKGESRKYRGSRGRSIANARSQGYQAAINSLNQQLSTGSFSSSSITKAENLRLTTTNKINKERFKREGLKAGTSKSFDKVEVKPKLTKKAVLIEDRFRSTNKILDNVQSKIQRDTFLQFVNQNKIKNAEIQKLNKKIQIASLNDNIKKINTTDLSAKQIELLKNIPKDIATGVYEVGKELVIFGKDAITNSFNYGKSLRKRFEAGENNPLSSDIKKIGAGAVDVSKFIINKPEQALAIVGMAGTSIGKDISTSFNNNPTKTLTKAVLYLFPSTVLSKTTKGTKAVYTLGQTKINNIQQLKRFNDLNKIVAPTRKANLSLQQLTKLNKAIETASKISNVTKRNQKVRVALNSILKQRGVKTKRGASLSQLSKEVQTSAKIPVKIISQKTKITKPKETIFKVKDKKIIKTQVLKKDELLKIKKTRDKTKFVKVKNSKAEKITKKEFVNTEKPIKLDVKELSGQAANKIKKLQKEQLSKSGITKKDGVTYIDLNYIKNLDKAQRTIKPITKRGLLNNKKAQAQFQIQINRQLNQAKDLNKLIKNKIKTKRKITNNNIKSFNNNKLKIQKINNLIKKIDVDSLFRGIKIAQTIKEFEVVKKAIEDKNIIKSKPEIKTEGSKDIKTKQDNTPRRDIVQKKGTKIKTSPKTKITTQKQKKRAITKNIKNDTLKKITRIPNFSTKLPKGERLKFDIKYRERKFISKPPGKNNPVIVKTIQLGLPENKAIKKGFGAVDKTTQASAELVIVGTTKAKDIKSKDIKNLKNKFKITQTKNKKALKFVEKKKNRIDTRGEKKGLSLSKALKPKKRTKRTKKNKR